MRSSSVCIISRLMDPPVWPLSKKNPKKKCRNTLSGFIKNYKVHFSYFSSTFSSPFKHQVQPVSNYCHPDELDTHWGPQVEPKREENEEGVPEVRCPGNPEKQALGILVVGLQVPGAAHPKPLHGIHDISEHLCLQEAERFQPAEPLVSLFKKKRTVAIGDTAGWFYTWGPTAQTHAHSDLWTLHMCNKALGVWEVRHTNKLTR